ncbi:MAG: glycosyl transferase 2 [Candidatus Peregrinibacteria bacterium Greene0416_19]|nr:MAG: glycosyl transferase 2 [Candidatus Peregrinibacteria bacterium Greene0416_19]
MTNPGYHRCVPSPRLTIVVPVYNEERTLETIIDRIFQSCGEIANVVFVDDGSKDRSLEILKRRARPQDTVLTKPNGGKGSAVRMGYAHAIGVYTIVQDADLEYAPSDIPPLLEQAEAHHLPAVFGSRRLKKQKQFVHLSTFIGGSMLTHICNMLYRTRLTDQPTCYKMVRTDIIRRLPLKENDFRFDPELTVLLAQNGIHIREFPVSYSPRTRKEGKKINWKDWFKWVWVFVSLRFALRTRWALRQS